MADCSDAHLSFWQKSVHQLEEPSTSTVEITWHKTFWKEFQAHWQEKYNSELNKRDDLRSSGNWVWGQDGQLCTQMVRRCSMYKPSKKTLRPKPEWKVASSGRLSGPLITFRPPCPYHKFLAGGRMSQLLVDNETGSAYWRQTGRTTRVGKLFFNLK